MRTRRQQKDHERYMRDRERRLQMAAEYRKAHPDYVKNWYARRCMAEIEHLKRLKRLEEQIWNCQMVTSAS